MIFTNSHLISTLLKLRWSAEC